MKPTESTTRCAGACLDARQVSVSVMRGWLGGLCSTLCFVSVTLCNVANSAAQNAVPQDTPEVGESASGQAPPQNDSGLAAQQADIAARFQRLEDLLLRSSELEGVENPGRAALLQQAAQLGKQAQLTELLAQAAGSLKSEQYTEAVQQQKASQDSLLRLLKLLQSENREKRIREQRDQVRRWIEETDRLLRLQGSLRGRTEGGQDTEQAASDQGKLADSAQEISDDLKGDNPDADEPEKDAPRADEPGANEPGADEPRGEDSDSKQTADGEAGKKSSDASQSGKPREDESGEEESGEKEPSESDKSSQKPGDEGKPESQASESQESEPAKEGKPSGAKQGESPESQSPESQSPESQSPESQSPESQSPESQPAEGQPQSQPGQPSESQSGQQGESGESPSQEPQPPQSPTERAQQKIEQAKQQMKEAQEALEDAQREGAVEKQREAENNLREAIEELEEILRQLREEEIERSLATLEDRLRRMLEMQTQVLDDTQRLQEITGDDGQSQRQIEIRASNLSLEQRKILAEGERAYLLLRDEGSSAAFPEAVEQLNIDIASVANRLAKADIGKLTVIIEQEIVSSLEEMVAALVQVQKDNQEKQRQQQQQGQAQQGQPGDQPLVDKLAELRLIRTLQVRINKRTEALSNMLEDPSDPIGQVEGDEIVGELRGLATRQSSIQNVTRDIVVGKGE